MDRPPADPVKLLSAWAEWESGETPPGRAVSNLKTGGLRDVVEHLAASAAGAADPEAALAPPDGVDASALLGAWMEWETGATPPAPVLESLRTAGLRPFLESLAGAAAGHGAGDGRG